MVSIVNRPQILVSAPIALLCNVPSPFHKGLGGIVSGNAQSVDVPIEETEQRCNQHRIMDFEVGSAQMARQFYLLKSHIGTTSVYTPGQWTTGLSFFQKGQNAEYPRAFFLRFLDWHSGGIGLLRYAHFCKLYKD